MMMRVVQRGPSVFRVQARRTWSDRKTASQVGLIMRAAPNWLTRGRASAQLLDSVREQTRRRPSQEGPLYCGARERVPQFALQSPLQAGEQRASRGSLQGNAARSKTGPHRGQQYPRRQVFTHDALQYEEHSRGRHVAVLRQDGAFMVERTLL